MISNSKKLLALLSCIFLMKHLIKLQIEIKKCLAFSSSKKILGTINQNGHTLCMDERSVIDDHFSSPSLPN
jgi:hypothetical protein